jgi:hypothetical protein
MIIGVIIGTIVSGLFPLLFLSFFRRAEERRLAEQQSGVAAKLEQIESEARLVVSHVKQLRVSGVGSEAAERSF